ncbi:MAG: hypothetical protein DLM62_16890 [Pseudonocardiales bacterium]|nr:MAG: hypothetical protein DLM62_16890 [Pseudonocardiales bacterium]
MASRPFSFASANELVGCCVQPESERAGELSQAQSVLEWWPQLDDAQLNGRADPALGVYEDVIVAAYDLDPDNPWTRRPSDDRVKFRGAPSSRWAHLIGTPNPGWKFKRRGVQKPVQFVPDTVFTDGHADVEPTPTGDLRAVIAGYVLTVSSTGEATLTVPVGGSILVSAR